MKKLGLLVLLCASFAMAREINKEIAIEQGPYLVPVTNSQFDVLSSDFKSQGEAFVMLADGQIHLKFPRTYMYSLKAKEDKVKQEEGDTVRYFYTTDKTSGVIARIGVDTANSTLEWFYSSSKKDTRWDVKIKPDAQKKGVVPVVFVKIEEQDLEDIVESLCETYELGEPGPITVKKLKNGSVEVTFDLLALEQDADEPTLAGEAKISFREGRKRSIAIQATLK